MRGFPNGILTPGGIPGPALAKNSSVVAAVVVVALKNIFQIWSLEAPPGRKWTSEINTFVGTLIIILRFLESLEPPRAKSKVLVRFA